MKIDQDDQDSHDAHDDHYDHSDHNDYKGVETPGGRRSPNHCLSWGLKHPLSL